MATNNHAERKHSKFSASGSERWLNCAASVELEEMSPPSKDSFWSLEGTWAHEVLEKMLLKQKVEITFDVHQEMIDYVKMCVDRILKLKGDSKLFVERRLHNKDIHPEMFGTCDVIIPKIKKALIVNDFKFGQGHVVSPVKNTQLIQYGLAAARTVNYDEKLFPWVSLQIMQPRASNGDWHKIWNVRMEDLKNYWLPIWKKGVARVERGNNKPFAGSWCHWCRAKDTICPLKNEIRMNRTIRNVFIK